MWMQMHPPTIPDLTTSSRVYEPSGSHILVLSIRRNDLHVVGWRVAPVSSKQSMLV